MAVARVREALPGFTSSVNLGVFPPFPPDLPMLFITPLASPAPEARESAGLSDLLAAQPSGPAEPSCTVSFPQSHAGPGRPLL